MARNKPKINRSAKQPIQSAPQVPVQQVVVNPPVDQDGKTVGQVKSRPHKNLKVGKPEFRVLTAKMTRAASMGGMAGSGTSTMSGQGSFYSPEWSTDFLELPQSMRDKWHWYRLFYQNHPYVHQAINVHTDLPMSKIRLSPPVCKDKELGKRAMRFCKKWEHRIGLFDRLYEIVFEFNLIGEVFAYIEDNTADPPRMVREEPHIKLHEDGTSEEYWVERPDADTRELEWIKKNYKGWTSIRILPPETVDVKVFPFSDEKRFELIPGDDMIKILTDADMGDRGAQEMVSHAPEALVQAVRDKVNIVLPSDPDAGSHLAHLVRKKSQYEPRGHSMLEACIKPLVHQDKLRQAQAQIASRHMTPIRLIYGEGLDGNDVDMIRDQIELAVIDPDYSIIANKQITWEEMGADARLLDLSGEYEQTNSQLYAGLGVTESLLTGESAYSGDRISLEVINTRYLLLRQILSNFVEKHLFIPMCQKMGFVEIDEDGDEVVIFPKLSFTRLALRDNQDTFNDLYNLYSKGSLGVSAILDLLNIDYEATQEELERSMFTVNDPMFNEFLRGVYTGSAEKIIDGTDVLEKLAKAIKSEYKAPAGESRF